MVGDYYENHPPHASLMIYSEPFIWDWYSWIYSCRNIKWCLSLPRAYIRASWLCVGISAVVSVCVFAPHVSASVSNSVCICISSTGILPLRFGTLKVLEPSQTPYVVDMIAKGLNTLLYSLFAQSQRRNHVRAVLVLHILISPVMPLCI